jgi:hypothetical protein
MNLELNKNKNSYSGNRQFWWNFYRKVEEWLPSRIVQLWWNSRNRQGIDKGDLW